MAFGGVLLSLFSPRIGWLPSGRQRLRAAFALCASAALASLLPLGLITAAAVSFLIGSGLGLLTVTLVTNLRSWVGPRHPLLCVGLGTGIGYFLCNFPPLFNATPNAQALVSALLCLAGMTLAGRRQHMVLEEETPAKVALQGTPFLAALGGFTALVWLDSAAFFIIQNTPALKAGTWGGTRHLWTNAVLHLLAALASVWLLRRRGLPAVLLTAFAFLGTACLLLLHPANAVAASVLYPIGVSLYSVGLVAYPSLMSRAATVAHRGRQAGWIYAVAGWIGSAMGIGMGQHLGHVPPVFVWAAGLVVALAPLLRVLRLRRREVGATLALLLTALLLKQLSGISHVLGSAQAATQEQTAVQSGRQVYIAEGCIHCHSQYIRPNSPDVLMWGPAQSIEVLRREHPPLIGNRRQGPDLSEVGSRRSPLWLKAHLYDPAQVSDASFMPGYAYLFRDRRGDELLAYLESLRGGDISAHLRAEQTWQPSKSAVHHANADTGALLFSRMCATCHEPDGATRLRWAGSFRIQPPDLDNPLPGSETPHTPPPDRMMRLAQIVKFGIPDTDMPGHEYLSDIDVASIVAWLSRKPLPYVLPKHPHSISPGAGL
jgi:cbb3-type cytochrome c oxidase subunit II